MKIKQAQKLTTILLLALASLAVAVNAAQTTKPQHGIEIEVNLTPATAEADCLRIHVLGDLTLNIDQVSVLNARQVLDANIDCSVLFSNVFPDAEGITLYRVLARESLVLPMFVNVGWQLSGDRFSQTLLWPKQPKAASVRTMQPGMNKTDGGLHIIRISPSQ